jgi:hypothetical protein
MSGATIDTSWNYQVNPENTPWIPGYRFAVLQDASRWTGRHHGRRRRYRVRFEITADGLLRWTGGVKANAETLAWVERDFAKFRPGSNGGPA